jgi:methylmalonyl-CoA mutase N-terminal domain/subunit
MRDRFQARNPKSLLLRFHTQTAGSTLTAQQPLNNVVRVTLQAMSAVLGGTQSLHTNGYDEALALPSREAATLALRTQQIIAAETAVAEVADPLGGSYLVEHLTDRIAAEAYQLIARIDDMGGAVAAIESGFVQGEIEDAAYRFQRAVDRGEKQIVGLNVFQQQEPGVVELLEPDPELERQQCERLRILRRERNAAAVSEALESLDGACRSGNNVMYPLKDALSRYATIGEVSDTMRRAFGTYDAPEPT